MMTIKDLAANKALDSKDMSRISGGTGRPANPLLDVTSIFAPSNQFGTQVSSAVAFTGPQSNLTYQGDNDVILAGQGAQAINLGGNDAVSNNTAAVNAVSAPVLVQSV
jgi:hypothetical protein